MGAIQAYVTDPSMRYVGATLVGFAVSFGVEWLHQRRLDRRTKSAIREALAAEAVANLDLLDQYWDCFTSNVDIVEGRKTGDLEWPQQPFYTTIAIAASSPDYAQHLTARESRHSGDAAASAPVLQELVRQARSAVGDINAPLRRKAVRDESHRIRRETYYLGQTLFNIVLSVLEEQQEFASTRVAKVAERMRPIFEANQLGADRLWRTSAIASNPTNKGPIIVWRNDTPGLVKAGVKVFELGQPSTSNQVIGISERPPHNVVLRLSRAIRRRLRRRAAIQAIDRQAKQLAMAEQALSSTSGRSQAQGKSEAP